MCFINFFISHLLFILLLSLFFYAGLNTLIFLPKKKKTNIFWTVIGYIYYLAKKALFFSIIIFFVYFLLGILNFVSFIPLASLSKFEIDKSTGIVFSACITSIGVFAGFYFNKKQTYKEIVTRERIEWLHKMQEKLANYLEPTSSTVATSDSNEEAKASVEDNEIANRLYYELSFNINHHKDADALKALNKYHYARNGKPDKIKVNLALMDEVKLELVLDKGEEDELLFKIKDKRELEKLKNLISSGELEKIKIGKENENLDEGKEFEKELALLKKDLSEEFTKIFNETWGDIKREAD